ncbi:restriction endonuclease [Streptomyces sp. NPDC056512]|uniref:nSTAND3 domain-containing NTPase n=1 Tax=Streptomyces sp. NPDC056512 TaxID=3345846 RepID=UPI0036783E5D
MESFDLSRLTDFDFEAVCKDLFEEELGVSLEIFSAGPDGGVDLRHFGDAEEALIIQCKHWHRSTRSKLIEYIRKSEAPKVQRLRPYRYILATSVELTKDAKDKLFQALKPYATTPGDIYGRHELDALLRKHERVVRRHLRLWLTSATVLNSLLSKHLITRSHALTQEVNSTLRTYAVNPSYARALDTLERRNVCIIAGLPGIGKTTLGHVLCAHYLAHNYELVEISEDVDEANRAWDDSGHQIFYYDDFLGQTSLDEKLGKNEDIRLISLMRRVSASSNKKFILTTREYILARARQRYERLDRHPFDILTCVVGLGDYSRKARAEILYNHVYASPLPGTVKATFADPSTYRRILEHRNFNPRIIASTLADMHHLADKPDGAATEVLANLEDPSRLWDHIVKNQLDEPEIRVLKFVFSFLSTVPLRVLEESWRGYGYRVRDLRKSLAVLDGTMLRSFSKMETLFDTEENIHVEFHNPSVRDYLITYFSSDIDEIESLIGLVRYFDQLETLWIGLPVRGGGPVLLKYRELRGQLEEAATAAAQAAPVQDEEGITRQIDPVRRAWFLFEMSELLDSPTMRVLGFQQVDAHLRGSAPADKREIGLLLDMLAEDDAPEARQALESCVELELEHLFNVTNWAEIELADEVLQSIEYVRPGIAAQNARRELDSIREEYVVDAFEDWLERGVDSGYDESDIQEMVDFYSTGELTPAGFEEAATRLDRVELDYPGDPKLFHDYKYHARKTGLNYSEKLRIMMRSLGERQRPEDPDLPDA